MKNQDLEQPWLGSQDARKALRVKDCDLMHLREDGKISFKKKGNAYLYSKADIERIANTQKE